MKIVYLTAGAAGMYCGSCMHDNALAKAIRNLGADCVLQPVYTPIRTDEANIAGDRVFLGGIHIYLLQMFPWLRFLPRPLRGLLDFPPLIRFATKQAGSTDPAVLGRLSVSMLKGENGNQSTEFDQLCDWIETEMKADAVVLTNLLIGGGLPRLRRRLPNAKLIVMLQGDDIFLDHLPERYRSEAIGLCAELVQYVDWFCVHSDFYGQKMSALMGIPTQKIVRTPLSIDLAPYHQGSSTDLRKTGSNEFRLGYLARIAPEKGLHRLVEAFEKVAAQDDSISLHVAGWLGTANEPYLDTILQRIDEAGLSDRFTYHGSPELNEKAEFLHSLDLLSVPTEYEDPKGLFVLEALAAGTPVVMPDHGAFGELIQSTGGGVLFPPGDLDALASTILDLKRNTEKRDEMASEGRNAVTSKHSIETTAKEMLELIRR